MKTLRLRILTDLEAVLLTADMCGNNAAWTLPKAA
jgi:hypothetical protein